MSEKTIESLFGIAGAKTPVDPLMGKGPGITPDPNYRFARAATKAALAALYQEDNLLIWGPAGCGKTQFCLELGARLERPVVVISLGEESSVRQLLGGFSLKGGETQFEPGVLLRAIQREGSIIVLDEINMAPPGVAAMLNHLLQAREIFVPETGEKIPTASGVVVFATANTNLGAESGIYIGSQEQNAATRSRFAFVEMEYLDESEEAALIRDLFPGIDETVGSIEGRPFSEIAATLARSIRAAVEDGSISLPFSLRQQKRFCYGTLLFKSIPEAFRYAYWDGLDAVEKESAASIFQAVTGITL